MTEQLSFFVAGRPITQGGMRPATNKATGRPILITTGGDGLRQWRKAVTDVACLAVDRTQWQMTTAPVVVTYRFLLPMPASRPAKFKRMLIGYSKVMPDLDKLTRAIGDSLKVAKVYKDDGQIAEAHTAKYELLDHALIGVEVVVATLDEDFVTETMARLLERRSKALRVVR